MRKTINHVAGFCLLALTACSSASNESGLKEKITGRYALQTENEFDYIRDTIEIKANDQGKFDVVQSRWSSAKKDDPARPVNKVAGQWNNNSGSKILVADLQKSDTTLRITEQITGRLNIISFDFSQDKLINRSVKGEEKIYEKLKN